MNLTVSPMWQPEQLPTAHIAVVEDTTRRKRTEEALRESEEQVRFLSEVLEQSGQPFAVGYPDGHIGILNTAYCDLTDCSEEELRALDCS